MASPHHESTSAETAPSADDVLLRDQVEMIWAVEGEIRQLQLRIDQLEGDVLPQLIARLTWLERASNNATPAGDSGSSARSSSSAAAAAREAKPFQLMLGERNLGLPPAAAAALVRGPLHSLLNRSHAPERSGGAEDSLAACGAGSAEPSEAAVGFKRGRSVRDAGVQDAAATGACNGAAGGPVHRPYKRARVAGSNSSHLAKDTTRGASANFYADPDQSSGGDGGKLRAHPQAAVAASDSVSLRPTLENCCRSTSPGPAGADIALRTQPLRAAGLAAAAAIRASALQTGPSPHRRYSPVDAGSLEAGSSVDASHGCSYDGPFEGDTSCTGSDDEAADDSATCDEAHDHACGGRRGRTGAAGDGVPQRRVPAAKSRRHKCPHCFRGFGSLSDLACHIRTHTGERPYACTLCDAAFAISGNLRAHERAVHAGERPHACPQCDAAFAYSGNLRQHLRVHSGEKPYACTQCVAAYAASSDLRTHERAVHSGERPHACAQCGSAFARSSALRKHERAVHAGERPYACTQCNAAFANSGHLRRHERAVHSGEKPHACSQCDAAFSDSSHLRAHERAVHSGERPFACTQCDLAFASSGGLRKHDRAVHAGERPYACTQCDAAFAQSGNLRQHERTVHAGERPYACTHCDAAFTSSGGLRKHERAVHAGERPYACTQCDAAFTQSSNLRRHERAVHAGESPYACTQCDAAFAASKSLHKHERAVHPGERPH